MESDYKHRFMTCHQKLKTERFLSDFKKKKPKHREIAKTLKPKRKEEIGSFYSKERTQGQLNL